MANTLNVTFAGPPEQRIKVSFTPMAKVLTLLEQACSKTKPVLDPTLCQLVLHEGRSKRVVDLQTPFRLANIPTTANSKLELIKVRDAAPAAALSADVQRPSTSAQQAPAVKDASTSQTPDETGGSIHTAPSPQPQPQAAPPQPPSPSEQLPSATAPAPTQQPPPASEAQPPPPWKLLGLDREVVLFTKAALDSALLAAVAATGGARAMDVSDDFYDLTPEDLATIAQSSRARKEEAAQLRTSALREAADRAKAQAYGPVPVRVHLPDHIILQAAFSALEPLAKLQELLSRVVVPQLARPGAFSLYTTPPKQVLHDLSLTFFKAQLVPAAHVHLQVLGGTELTGPVLKPEFAALVQSCLQLEAALPGQAAFVTPDQLQSQAAQEAAATAAAARGPEPPAAAAAAAGLAVGMGLEQADGAAEAPRVTASGSKVPKWLKL